MVWARIECLDVSDNSVIGCLKLYLWVRSGGGSDFLGLERRIGFVDGESSVGFCHGGNLPESQSPESSEIKIFNKIDARNHPITLSDT